MPPDTSHCKVHTRVILDWAMTEQEKGLTRYAMQLWYNSTGGAACFDEAAGDKPMPILMVKNADVLSVMFSKDMSNVVGLYSYGGPFHRIFFVREAIGSESYFVTAAVHELGHSLGMGHVSDKRSCMFPSVNTACLETNPSGVPFMDVQRFINGPEKTGTVSQDVCGLTGEPH